jgi:hypothetical protein
MRPVAERRAPHRLRHHLPAITVFWALVATAETLIALALIFGVARKAAYLAAIVFSVLFWSTAEGFGGPYTSGSADIGTAIIYAVVFAGLLALSYYCDPDHFSADYYLEKKVTWWWRLAEVRRPDTPAAATTAAVGTVLPGAVPQPAAPADDTCRPVSATPSSHITVAPPERE